MLLEEARPVCPEDADAHPPQPSTLPTPSRREEKQRRCRDPSSSPHSHGSTSYTPANPGSAGLNSGPGRSGQGCRDSVPPQLPRAKQEREGRMQSASGNRQQRPGAAPKAQASRDSRGPHHRPGKHVRRLGLRAPLPTTAGGLEAPGQGLVRGTLTF